MCFQSMILGPLARPDFVFSHYSLLALSRRDESVMHVKRLTVFQGNRINRSHSVQFNGTKKKEKKHEEKTHTSE